MCQRRRQVNSGWLAMGQRVIWTVMIGCWLQEMDLRSVSCLDEGSSAAGSHAGRNPSTAVLLDTTEQSALGWTKYPDGGPQTRTPGWVEESFTNFERGINWRSFVVCDVAFNSVNNWLWTPFIERGDANRLYIEIKFTMRDCNLFPQMVLSCKETFALLYKEMDASASNQLQQGASNASFAQSDSYTLIDAIAADEGRFTSNTDVVINTELRSVPVTKRGLYFAFRDQGACLSLISIRVYHLKCPQLVSNFAQFNATPTGRDLTSLVAVEGRCVANSVQIEQPKLFCTADGQWNSMSSGQCKCLPGFEPAHNQTRCQACPANKFKSSLGELACQSCPERSSSALVGATECRCHEGFFRANKDARSAPCTQPPSAPTNLSATYVDSSSLVLQWAPPRYAGGRDDLSYRLLCDQCTGDQTSSMVSSPSFYANFSETKCVLSGLAPNTQYRFLVYALNGVSAQAGHQQQQFSEISVQTAKQVPQTTSNSLSAQGGFQLLPIYNFRALPGVRGSDMILAWDAQAANGGLQADLAPAGQPAEESLLPSLYEIRFQARPALDQRLSPYPASMISSAAAFPPPTDNHQHHQQSLTTTNRAVVIGTLTPRTEYAFQIRAKWAHSSQWSELSEPIYATTGSQMPPVLNYDLDAGLAPPPNFEPSNQLGRPHQQAGAQPALTSSGWLGSLAFVLLCLLIALAIMSLVMLHYRKSLFVQSLGLGFGPGAGGSAYGAVYGSGAGSDLMGGGFAGPGSPLQQHLQQQAGLMHQFHTHRAHLGAAHPQHAVLIAGSNGTTPSSRSSSGGGAANAVQSFLAATLGQLGGGGGGQGGAHNKTLVDGKRLFAPGPHPANPLTTTTPRNHYHQTQANHTLLLSTQHGHFRQPNGQSNQDLLKYRTLSQPGEQFGHQLDPQLHIYDDLDNAGSASATNFQLAANKEIDPQRVTVESVIGRGEFGDVCLARLRSSITGAESRVAVKTLKPGASERARLNLLVEASIMCQFEHPNIIHLEGMVTKSEPPMIVVEYMENKSLDAYLRNNKNSFTCLQLISMLRGVANGMQYLASLSYVHKDLAARNVLVNDQNVCKIADFGLSALQSGEAGELLECYAPAESNASSASSNTLSTSGSQPAHSKLTYLADQLAQQRFQQHLQQSAQTPPTSQPQSPKIPVRWTALEAIAFRRFTSASDVWSFGIVCWEVMTQGERPYWNWSNQDVIKAIEQGYRLPQPDGCPGELYKLMLDCWLKDRAARPTFGQIVKQLDRLLSPYDDPFCQAPQTIRMQNQTEPDFYDTYNHVGQLTGGSKQPETQRSLDEWLDSIKMSKYKENFAANQINSLQYAARLGQADLNLIGITNGQHVRRLLSAIASLRSSASIGASGEGYLV